MKELLAAFKAKLAEQTALLAKGEALSAEDQTKLDAVEGELVSLEGQIEQAKKNRDVQKKNAERLALLSDVERPATGGNNPAPSDDEEDEDDRPARTSKSSGIIGVTRSGNALVFSGTPTQARKKAHRFGNFCLAAFNKNERAIRFCKDNGIALKAQSENSNQGGGYLVPEEFETEMIDLREQYGVVRRLAKVVRMTSDTKTVPRRTSGLTAYFIGEGQTIPDTKKGWDRIGLAARKLGTIVVYSSELSEDAIIDIGNDLADEIAYAFAKTEDECAFLGDGTSKYGRITGACQRLRDVDATVGNIKGISVTTATALGDVTLPDYTNVKKRLPRYARDNARWYCNAAIYDGSMEKLALASGGVTAAEVSAGVNADKFMGRPVEFVEALPDDPQPGQIFALFGDLKAAMTFGDRRQMTLAMSEHANFEEDEIAIRGTQRFDINVHGVGDTTKAGPLVAIMLHA